jgi:hypothetical protein
MRSCNGASAKYRASSKNKGKEIKMALRPKSRQTGDGEIFRNWVYWVEVGVVWVVSLGEGGGGWQAAN